MARSEQLVLIDVVTWERSIDRVRHQIRPVAIEVDADSLRGAVGLRRFVRSAERVP